MKVRSQLEEVGIVVQVPTLPGLICGQLLALWYSLSERQAPATTF